MLCCVVATVLNIQSTYCIFNTTATTQHNVFAGVRKGLSVKNLPFGREGMAN